MEVKNILKETEQSLSELWELLRKKENSVGLDILSFTDRDILENILSLIKENNKKILFIVFASLIATLLILGILCLFYQLLYGFLLKKLNTNYKELAKLDTNR